MARDILADLGFLNAFITNRINRYDATLSSYSWQYQDADQMSIEDDTFDWFKVQSRIHHCYSPHKALAEMTRVARKSVLVFEVRDSFYLVLVKQLEW